MRLFPLWLIGGLFSLLVTGCLEWNPIGPVRSVPPGAYRYTGYDSTDHVRAEGWLTFNIQDSTHVTGEWKFTAPNVQGIGPQDGNGTLLGGFTDGKLWVDLHPDFRDNNIFLVGRMTGNIFQGTWSWSTFAGPTAQGRFEAVRNVSR